MRYLVKFKEYDREWIEYFETEKEVLERSNSKGVNVTIEYIRHLSEDLTIEQIKQMIDNETPQELQEADFKGKHIKVGDMVFFEREFYDSRDDENYYRDFYGIIKSIISQKEEITVTITTIAFDNGELLEPYNKQKKETKQWCMVLQPETQNIRTIYAVCDENYFNTESELLDNAKYKYQERMVEQYNEFCTKQDEQIERLNVLKGML